MLMVPYMKNKMMRILINKFSYSKKHLINNQIITINNKIFLLITDIEKNIIYKFIFFNFFF